VNAGAAPPSGAAGHLDPRWVGTWYPQELWHFHRQLLARYNIVLEPGEFSMIKAALRSGKAQHIETKSDGQTIYSIRIPRVFERVYVLAHGDRIITAWPPERRLNAIRRRLSAQET
jgi:hypothetical protein